MTKPGVGPRVGWGPAVHELGRAFDPSAKIAGLPDSALLARFRTTGDEAAFAALVDRHGPMVLAAARSVVRSSADAEDVFQATFFVLARRAGSVRAGDSVGGWLHRVARHAALRAAARRASRARRERLASAWLADPAAPAPPDRPEADEVARLVHEELDRLPVRLRAAVVACDLEGLTRAEAATRLGWPTGTVASRLGRGRDLLRARLTRRGLGADTSAGLAALLNLPQLAPVPPAWMAQAVRTGSATAGAGLASVVLRGLTRATLARWGLGLAVASSLVLVPTLLPRSAPPEAPHPPTPVAPRPPQSVPAVPLADSGPTEPFAFRGQVVDPDGAPVAGAKVYLVDRGHKPAVPAAPSAVADARGRFEFRAPIPRPKPGDGGTPPREHDNRVRLLATAPGFGVGFVRPPWAGPTEVALARDAGPVQVRVVDSRNRPVAGARFEGISLLVPPLAAGGNGGIAGWRRQAEAARDLATAGKLLAEGLDHALDGPDLAAAVQLPAAADADGRITIAGLGHDRAVSALVSGPGIATQAVILTTDRLNGPPVVVNPGRRRFEPGRSGFEYTVAVLGLDSTLVGKPSVLVGGTVRTASTGTPLPGVVVRLDDAVSALKGEYLMAATTDANGRFGLDGVRVNARAQFSTHSPAGSPVLDITRMLDVETGPDGETAALDIQLPSGVEVNGRITATSSRKLDGIEVRAMFDPASPFVQQLGAGAILPEFATTTDAEGRFRLQTFPGLGFLTATRSLHDDAFGIGSELLAGLPFHDSPRPTFETVPTSIRPDQVNTIVRVNVPSNVPTFDATIPLLTTSDRAGTVVDLDGQPVRSGVNVYGLSGLTTATSEPEAKLMDEHFTVRRLVPGRLRRVLFIDDAARRVGLLTTRDAEGPPLTVTLQPWGAVRVRVDAPGDTQQAGFVYAGPEREAEGRLFPESQFPFVSGYWTAKDRPQFEVTALVPDLPYRLVWGGYGDHPVIARNVRGRSGETLDLGTIRVEPPK